MCCHSFTYGSSWYSDYYQTLLNQSNNSTPKAYRNFTENGNPSVKIDLPGYKKDEVTLELDTDTLTVTAKNESRGEKVYQVYVSEYIDTDKITSTLENGVLTISAEIYDECKPRKIEIK